MHTIGSHWWYPSHYEERHRKFLPDISHRDVSRLSQTEMTNAYDNTIIATDEFLHGLATRFRDTNTVLLYISDHGESLGEGGIYLHAEEGEPQHHPACLIWWGKNYANNFPEKIERILTAYQVHATTSDIFHTVIDIAGISTPAFIPNRSFVHITSK